MKYAPRPEPDDVIRAYSENRRRTHLYLVRRGRRAVCGTNTLRHWDPADLPAFEGLSEYADMCSYCKEWARYQFDSS